MTSISNILYMMQPLYMLQLHPIEGDINAEHLKQIHKAAMPHMKSGEYRTHYIWKFPSSDFADHTKISDDIDTAFEAFQCSKEDLPVRCAKLQWTLNHIHPFEDGNGRTQREMIREICLKESCIFDLSFTTIKDMVTASHSPDPDMLTDIFKTAVRPHENPQSFYDSCKYIVILSKDDVPEQALQYFKTHLADLKK